MTDQTGPSAEHSKRQAPPAWSSAWEACRLICRGYTVRTGVAVAVVVGSLLSAINEGGDIARDRLGIGTWLRIVANYAVPFTVASIGYLAPFRRR